MPCSVPRRSASAFFPTFHLILFLPLLMLLLSCGGGGDSGGTDGFSVALNRSALSFSQYEGTPAASQIVTATATGTYNGTLYVGAVVENNGAVNAINPAIALVISGTQATATVTPMSTLSAGTYTGRILFLACSDPACNNRIGGTPLPVSFTVTVLASVQATPNPIDRTVISGSSASVDVVVTPGANETGYSVDSTAAWIQISNQTAGGMRVSLPSLPVGTYNANLPLVGSNGSRLNLPVIYRVGAPPGGQQGIVVSPAGLTFATSEGASAPAQSLQVTQPTWLPGMQAPLIQYNQGENWLRINDMVGGYQVVADATNLTAGTYTANLMVRSNPLPAGIADPSAPFADKLVPISLTVGIGLVRPADISRTIDANTTTAQLSGSVPVTIVSGPAVDWAAVSDASWLSLTRASGQTDTNINYTLNNSVFAALENGREYTAHITVTPSLATMTPVTYDVRVTKWLAQVTNIAPYVQISSKPIRLVVRGIGFDAISNFSSGLTIQGAVNPTYTRVNDTEVVVEAAAMSPGSYLVNAPNQSGIGVTGKSIKVIAPHTYAYATLPTGGAIASMLYDPERDAVYFANTGLSSLRRYRYSNGNWSLTTMPIPGIANLGMTPDGASLVVATSASTSNLRLLDATQTTSFTEQIRFDVANISPGYKSIPILNDGRAWFAAGPGYSIGTVNLATGSLTQLQQDSYWLFETPSFALGRDGERLFINQNGCCTGPRPFYTLYFDAAGSVAHENPAGYERFYWGNASDDGNRVVFNWDTVYNRNFEQIGRIALPSQWLKLEAQISPDGARTYVVTYAESEFGRTDPPILRPRVYVIDSSTQNPTQSELPVLGYFELNDYPTCRRFDSCDMHPLMSISLDGRTLFFSGNQNFIVAPIPAESSLTIQSAPARISTQSTSSQITTQRWDLNLSK